MTMTDLANDLLNGPKEIAAFMGLTEHSVRHYIRKDALPAFRSGNRIMSRKSTILHWIEAQEAASLSNRKAA